MQYIYLLCVFALFRNSPLIGDRVYSDFPVNLWRRCPGLLCNVFWKSSIVRAHVSLMHFCELAVATALEPWLRHSLISPSSNMWWLSYLQPTVTFIVPGAQCDFVSLYWIRDSNVSIHACTTRSVRFNLVQANGRLRAPSVNGDFLNDNDYVVSTFNLSHGHSG